MASREDDFRTRMIADAPLMAILTGGVYARGAIGLEGISRDTTPAAFDANGYLRPCALVAQAGDIPDGNVKDYETQAASANQRVEVWLYQDQGSYAAIDAAVDRIYTLFQGHVMAGTFEIYLANHISRQRDRGALDGSSLERLDFIVPAVMGT